VAPRSLRLARGTHSCCRAHLGQPGCSCTLPPVPAAGSEEQQGKNRGKSRKEAVAKQGTECAESADTESRIPPHPWLSPSVTAFSVSGKAEVGETREKRNPEAGLTLATSRGFMITAESTAAAPAARARSRSVSSTACCCCACCWCWDSRGVRHRCTAVCHSPLPQHQPPCMLLGLLVRQGLLGLLGGGNGYTPRCPPLPSASAPPARCWGCSGGVPAPPFFTPEEGTPAPVPLQALPPPGGGDQGLSGTGAHGSCPFPVPEPQPQGGAPACVCPGKGGVGLSGGSVGVWEGRGRVCVARIGWGRDTRPHVSSLSVSVCVWGGGAGFDLLLGLGQEE